MIRDRVREFTESQGYGDISLFGPALNFRRFSSVFELNQRFHYLIDDQIHLEWEYGIGYLSSANVLVREKIIDSSAPGRSRILLKDGVKDVVNEVNMTSGFSSSFTTWQGSTYTSVHSLSSRGNTTVSLTANVVHFPAFFLTYGGYFSAMKVRVLTAQASAQLKMGIYDINEFGTPGKKIQETGTVSAATTGLKLVNFTSDAIAHLSPGWYYAAVIVDVTNVGFGAYLNTEHSSGPSGVNIASQLNGGVEFNQGSFSLVDDPNPSPFQFTALGNTVRVGMVAFS